MIKILVFLLIGALIGCIAGKIMGNEKQGFIRNALLGLVGSFVGGMIGNLLKIGGGWISGIILSVIGACLVLFLLEKVKKFAVKAGCKGIQAALRLYYALDSPTLPTKVKAMIIAALGYLISPLDVVPDAIPIAGLADDLGVLVFVLKKVWTDVDPDIQVKARQRLAKWFDEDEIEEINDLFKGE